MRGEPDTNEPALAGPGLPLLPPAARTGQVGHRTHVIPAQDWQRLAASARTHALDPMAALTSLYADVVRRWSGSARFTVWHRAGGGVDHRNWPHATGLAGCRPLTIVNEACDTVASRTRRIAHELRREVGEPATPHRLDPVEEPVAHLRLANHGDVTPAVAVTIGHRPAAAGGTMPRAGETAGQLVWELQLQPGSGEVALHWLSRDGMLPPGLTGDAFAAYLAAVSVLVDDHDRWLDHHVIAIPPTVAAQIARMNATTAPVPDGMLHTPLRTHAAVRPSAEAVVTPDVRLTCAELDARVNRVAGALRASGAAPNRLVAIVMDRGWEQVVALYAVLTAGAAYLPVDPQLPPERLRKLLTHGDVAVALTQSWLERRLMWPDRLHRLCVDQVARNGPATPLAAAQGPRDLAYVIPTSGSTGEPKFVMVDHRGALNAVRHVAGTYEVGPEDRCFSITGIQFDISVFDHFGVLGAGGTLVLPRPTPRPAPAAWADQLRTCGVTLWNSVPALLEMVVAQMEADSSDTHPPPLRLAILGGDFIPLSLPDRLRRLVPGVRVVNGGGPAESCVYSIMYEIGDLDPHSTTIPYGRPIANQRYFVLAEDGQQCPTWVVGELYIASDVGLAIGYWHDEALTSQRFQHRADLGGRCYATGDLGRYLPGGVIELVGRKDLQVKLQGVRIELGEIEAAITSHPQVATAAVIALSRHGRGVIFLRGYVVWRDGRVGDPSRLAALREHLAAALPPHLLPASLEERTHLPLTPNGKVDRLALAGRR